jgi:hypothetical protein
MRKMLLLFLLSVGWATLVSGQVAVKVDGRNIPYERFSSFKIPGAELNLEVQDKQGGVYRVFLENELRSTFRSGSYTMAVPAKSGQYGVQIMDSKDKTVLALTVFVLVPIQNKQDEYLYDFRVGNYPPPLGEAGKYERPKGFVEVTKENMNTQLSPHFRLSQFVPDQKGKRKFIVIRESLLLKLEYLLNEVNRAGVGAKTLMIRTAYLTPYQNAEKGNAIYSRHIYGDAAQIIIDRNNDGVMDDLNRDGVGDMKDVRWLFDLVDKLSGKPDYQKLEGGLAHYRLNKKYGGYVYIDARGNKMRF